VQAHARIPALGVHRGLVARLPGLSDDRLARLVAGDSGDRAFTALYERYHQPLYRYCRSLLRHDSDAQDALQSTFASAYTALRRGQRARAGVGRYAASRSRKGSSAALTCAG
jgi:Sigma-70 region 2